MLLPDCKCRSGFFEVIRLLTFSLPLLPPLFLPLFFLLFRLLLRCSRAAPVPGAQPGGYAKGRCKIALQRPRCCNVLVVAVTCLLCRIRPGNPAGIVPRKILRGGLCCVFCMGVRGSRVARLPGRQARTSTGYGFGRRRVSALRFPTDALRFRLFSKGILPAATVFCTRNCGGRNPASSW